jgi:hypothetical protein
MAARHFIGLGLLGSVWACGVHLDVDEACFLDPVIHKQALKNSFFDRVFEDAQT